MLALVAFLLILHRVGCLLTHKFFAVITIAWLILGSCFSIPVFAHDPFSGLVAVTIAENNELKVEVHFPTVTVEGWVGHIHDRNNQVSSQNLPNIQGELLKKARGFFTIRSGEKNLEMRSAHVTVINHKDEVIFNLVFAAINAGQPLFIQSDFLRDENPEFKSTLSVFNARGKQLALEIQNVNKLSSVVSLTRENKPWQTFTQFLIEGMHHIFIGFDHLLFLFALLLVCNSLRPAVILISCFTLAHSVTLALAALNIVQISTSMVELFIALTIVYVGTENLYTRHRPKMRWLLTSVFGLIHGLGFANVLRDTGLGEAGASIVVPLLAFNLGVELGQIGLALLFLPLLWSLRRRKLFVERVLPILSIAAVIVGAYWAVIRLQLKP